MEDKKVILSVGEQEMVSVFMKLYGLTESDALRNVLRYKRDMVINHIGLAKQASLRGDEEQYKFHTDVVKQLRQELGEDEEDEPI